MNSKVKSLTVGLSLLLLSLPCLAQEKDKSPEKYKDKVEKIVKSTLKKNDSYKKLQELCDDIGARLSGSKALDEAIAWAVKTLKADGHVNVRTEKVMVPKWTRGRESATILEPKPYKLSILGLGGSVGTPKEGVTAQVLVVHSRSELEKLGAAVKGKIVLFNVPMPKYDPVKGAGYGETVRFRTQGAKWAGKEGAVAALVRSITATSLQSPHTGGMRYGKDGPRIPNAAVSIEDAERIERLCKRGKKVVVNLKMEAKSHGLVPSANVMAEIRGSEKPDEIVVIGGHIDSWDVGQGAHDDGAGCVIAMEALNRIRQLKLKPRRTIRVVLWTNEENGLAGAKAYAKAHKDEMSKHVAAIESDSGGFQPLGFHVDHRDPKKKSKVIERVQSILNLVPTLGKRPLKSKSGYSGADIGPIKLYGAPTLGLWVDGSKYFNYHHTRSDTVDKVNPKELSRNTALMAAMAFVLADAPGRLDDGVEAVLPELQRSQPLAVAEAVMKAYKAKKFVEFAELVQPSKKDWTAAQLTPGTPIYESLFGAQSWRWKAVQSWSGKLGKGYLKDQKDGQQWVRMSISTGQKETVVIELKKRGKEWFFEDLRKVPSAELKSWGKPMK